MKLAIVFVTLLYSINALPQTDVAEGARLYMQRCSLCHGNRGMGDGLMPTLVENYPNVNLATESKFDSSLASLVKIINWGGSRGNMSPLSPPWYYELNQTQIQQLANFVLLLRSDNQKAQDLMANESRKVKHNFELGQKLYLGRCTICHGKDGDGRGKLAGTVVVNPLPFNFRQSTATDSYLLKMIEDGGESMGRSKQMPPWKNELLNHEIRSLLIYIKHFRTSNNANFE